MHVCKLMHEDVRAHDPWTGVPMVERLVPPPETIGRNLA